LRAGFDGLVEAFLKSGGGFDGILGVPNGGLEEALAEISAALQNGLPAVWACWNAGVGFHGGIVGAVAAIGNDGVENNKGAAAVLEEENAEREACALGLDFHGGKLSNQFHSQAAEAGAGIVEVDGLDGGAAGGPAKVEKLPVAARVVAEALGEALGEKQNAPRAVVDGDGLGAGRALANGPLQRRRGVFFMEPIPRFGAGE
jgi:hypothetical protein